MEEFPNDDVFLDGKANASVDVVYIVHLRALPHCWKPYCGLCG